jgi:RHS repeat-associated protein
LLTDIIAGLLATPDGLATSKGATVNGLATGPNAVSIPETFLNRSPNEGDTKPMAYINYILLDEQFQYVKSGFSRVGPGGSVKDHFADLQNIGVTQNGYLYVYCSNQSPVDVYFDNLQIVHTRGPLVEETHYYPFGLTMAGISSQALNFGTPENNKLYNKGSELQHKEFSDGSGLELYSTNFRSLDPQLGRWWQIDPKPDMAESPYSSMGNNPISYNDPLGDTLDFPGATSEFIDEFFDAWTYLNDHGVGDNISYLNDSPIHFSVYEDNSEFGDSKSATDYPLIYWNPKVGTLTHDNIVLSPALTLDHEADHQKQRVTHPEQYRNDSKKGSDKQYDTKEERRVITGREQMVAIALGEIKKGQYTRKDHGGFPYPVKSSTDHTFEKMSKEDEKKAVDSIIKTLKQQHPYPGSAGSAGKRLPQRPPGEE